nr:ribosomal RNA-processing protein 8 [Cryptococcus depauperatus CBS 7841]
MSLFPSAFENKLSTAELVLSSSTKVSQASKKRKRFSLPTSNEVTQQANINFEKVLRRFEDRDVKEKDEGQYDMGLSEKKKKSKKNRKEGVGRSNGNNGTRVNEISQVKSLDQGPQAKSAFLKKLKSEKIPLVSKLPEPVQLPIPSQVKSTGTKKLKVSGEGTMTDMQKNMQSKLEEARFRWINEQLYSTPSAEAMAMMQKDPKIFADYHQTHRFLTSAWPNPPLPHLIQLLSTLPTGTIIADLGCGDAGLAKALMPKGKVVLSFDLVEMGGWVVEADFLEKVPLPANNGNIRKKNTKKVNRCSYSSEIVDVVVCCLSLMGTNWVGGISEACRILKQGGTFHIAEVTSRFISIEAFVQKVESFGFQLEEKSQPSTHFTLFQFTKTTNVPLGSVRGQDGWEERVREGEAILRACVYKKR